MESTWRPSVRQPVSCDVVWEGNWVGVMSQKSSDRGEAMWRNLASISVCNRSLDDLQGQNLEISHIKTFQISNHRRTLCLHIYYIFKQDRVQTRFDQMHNCYTMPCLTCENRTEAVAGKVWDALTSTISRKHLSPWILIDTLLLQLSHHYVLCKHGSKFFRSWEQ